MFAFLLVCILYIIKTISDFHVYGIKGHFSEPMSNNQWLGASTQIVRDDTGWPSDSPDLVAQQMAAAAGSTAKSGVFATHTSGFTEPLLESGRWPNVGEHHEPWAKHSNSTAAAPAAPATVASAPATGSAVGKFTDRMGNKTDPLYCQTHPGMC
jgi:hypothetical protein